MLINTYVESILTCLLFCTTKQLSKTDLLVSDIFVSTYMRSRAYYSCPDLKKKDTFFRMYFISMSSFRRKHAFYLSNNSYIPRCACQPDRWRSRFENHRHREHSTKGWVKTLAKYTVSILIILTFRSAHLSTK